MAGIFSRPAWGHGGDSTRMVRIVLAGLLLVLVASDAVWACPNCKNGIADGGNGLNLVRGYGWSIIFMMSMPFTILGSIATYFYLLVRKATRERAAEIPPAGLPSFQGSASVVAGEP